MQKRQATLRRSALGASLTIVACLGCSGAESSTPPGSGGDQSAGGAPTGGAVATGGNAAQGGSPANGGAPATGG